MIAAGGMEKEKGKQRSDLLKAGRKKLQQYRQKKGSKGISQGQASNKPSDSEQHGAETDADADAASIVKQTAVQLGSVEEANSSPEMSTSESSYDTDISTAGPFSVPFSPRRVMGETEAVSIGPGVEMIGTQSPDTSNTHSVMMVSPSETSEIPIIGWTSLDPADSTNPPSSFNEAVATAEVVLEEGEAQVTEVGAMQEVGYVGSKEFHNNSVIEPKDDARVAVSEVGDDPEIGSETSSRLDQAVEISLADHIGSSSDVAMDDPIAPASAEFRHEDTIRLALSEFGDNPEIGTGASSGLSGMTEQTIRSDQSCESPVVSIASLHLSAVADLRPKVTDLQTEEMVPDSSKGEKLQMLFEPKDSEICHKQGLQGEGEDMTADEGHRKQDLTQVSTAYEANINEEPLKTNTNNFSGECDVSSTLDISSISLTQLAEVINGLDENDFRFLLKSRESDSNAEVHYHAFHVFEKFKEQLFLTNIGKDLFHLKISEQAEMQVELESQYHQLVEEISVLSTSHNEVKDKNKILAEELARCSSEIMAITANREELQNQFNFVKVENEAFSALVNDLQFQLEKSREGFSELSTEIANCRDLVADLQVKNKNLNENLVAVAQDSTKLAEEKEYLVNENENLLSEIAGSKGFVASLQLKIANLSDSLSSVSEERRKLEEAKGHFIDDTEILSTKIVGFEDLVASLELQNAKLVERLSLVTEERKKLEEGMEYHIHEKERLLLELLVHAELLSTEHADHRKLELELKNANLSLEQLHMKNTELNCRLENMHILSQDEDVGNGFEGSDDVNHQNVTLACGASSHQIHGKQNDESLSGLLGKASPNGLVEDVPPKQLKMGVYDNSFGFVALKGHLKEAGKIMEELDMAIEQIHSHSASLSRVSGKVSTPQVSKLIQAFESKGHMDDNEAEELPLHTDQLLTDLFLSTKEQTEGLRTRLLELSLDIENASELVKGEREARKLADFALNDLKDHHELLKSHSNSLEARTIELEVCNEALKQHLCQTESKNVELEVLCRTLRQQEINLEAENCHLSKKLSDYQSRISELESNFYEIQESSGVMASKVHNQLENLRKEVTDEAALLQQELNSSSARVAEAVGMLDAFVARFSDTNISSGGQDGLDIGSRVATSVNTAIQVMETKLEATCTDLELIRSSYTMMNDKYFDLDTRNELATSTLHKIYGDLGKLMKDYGVYTGELEASMNDEKLLDPLHYQTLTEKLGNFLAENAQLESVNSKLNIELTNKTKVIEDMNHRCLDLDVILKLVEDIEGVVMLEDGGTNLESDNLPVSHLLSLVSILLQKYKEACMQITLSREELASKLMELSELEQKVHDMYSLNLCHENKIVILTESLNQAEGSLVSAHSELQKKATDLELSEQRVSSVREKLSIAVGRGKSLVVQRDSLKQSLAEASIELEKCSEELKLKDARLQEVELKLKIYSEAGERVEALESELSYIRNSATALRESFLLKDSVLQRIEEILEDLELPEHFHSRDIIEKVDWLARTVTGNSLPLPDWDQKSSVEGASYSDGIVVMDAWKEDAQPSSNMEDDTRRKCEELQSKLYGLAEQNEMLEQSLMERNNLVQRWEEALDTIHMPSQLQSMEPEDRIEWLGSAFSEALHITNMLQQKADNLENDCRSLTADLDASRGRISELEMTLQDVGNEKEHISGRLENLIRDNERVSERSNLLEQLNDELHKEVSSLWEKLADRNGIENRFQTMENGIKRLQVMIIEVLHDPVSDDLISNDNGTEFLEVLLRKLIQKYATPEDADPEISDEALVKESSRDALAAEEQEIDVLKKELEVALSNLMHVKEERDIYVEKHRALLSEKQEIAILKKELEEALTNLTHVKEERDIYVEKHCALLSEVEVINGKRDELLELHSQEEQKSATIREKLNVAVRKGKLLVQQRDGLKQTIEELNSEVDHLKAEICHQKNALAEYEQKVNELCTYRERVEALEPENMLLRNQLADMEHDMQEKEHIVSMMTNVLGGIDVDTDTNFRDPVDKLEHVGELCCNLRAAVASSEQELTKSKRAAELLLAELNEVQERNDSLQEDLVKAADELSKISKERDFADTVKHEALSRVEQLSAVQFEDRNILFEEFLEVKSWIGQLRKGFCEISSMLVDVSSKDLELLRSVEAGMESCLKSKGATEQFNFPFVSATTGIISTNSTTKEDLLSQDLSDSQIQQDFNGNKIYGFVKSNLQEITTEIGVLREKIYEHFMSFNEEVNRLSKVITIVQGEMASQKESVDELEKRNSHIEYDLQQNDLKIVSMGKKIATLYEACTSSILEMDKTKAQLVQNNSLTGDPWKNVECTNSSDGIHLLAGNTPLYFEEDDRAIAERLFSSVKEFSSMQAELIEGNQKEMKLTISNLQKELQEKDIQRERICRELITQIKEAEAATTSYQLDLQSAELQVHDLEKRVEILEEERNSLKQRVEKLQDGEASLIDSQQRVRSLTDMLAAKEQEIEVLMQALDEEEVQMENLTMKADELEKVVHKKNIDVENLEASRAKAMKKLTTTVTKFDELHHLSGNLLIEVEKLQAQVHDRDAEISFLRQEITRCTNDALVTLQMNSQRNSDEIHSLLTWLDSIIPQVGEHDGNLDDRSSCQDHKYQEILQKRITSIMSELEHLRVAGQNGDALLKAERERVEVLLHRGDVLEAALREKESQLNLLRDADLGKTTSMTSEIVEVEPVINKWVAPIPSIAPQVRSLRKGNNDQVAIAVDMDQGTNSMLEDEDDDKVHGFKSLTTSRIVPRFTRPVSDLIDGLWVSCDRALMRQPALRLGIIIYWAVLHALLGTFVV